MQERRNPQSASVLTGLPSGSRRSVEGLIAEAASDREVVAVLLFGSQATGSATAGSDVDVCLVVRPELSSRQRSEARLRYASRFDVDVRVFQQVPIYVRRRILKEGRVLLETDGDAFWEVVERTVREWELFRPHYEAHLEAVAHGRP